MTSRRELLKTLYREVKPIKINDSNYFGSTKDKYNSGMPQTFFKKFYAVKEKKKELRESNSFIYGIPS